jgi:hypothetical protein
MKRPSATSVSEQLTDDEYRLVRTILREFRDRREIQNLSPTAYENVAAQLAREIARPQRPIISWPVGALRR